MVLAAYCTSPSPSTNNSHLIKMQSCSKLPNSHPLRPGAKKKGKSHSLASNCHDTRHKKEQRKKKVKLHGDVPPTSYLSPFSLTFCFFFLHMHACMPTEQKKAQDRKKKKEISNRNCKAGNLDTARRLPLQELINRYLPTSCICTLLTLLSFFSFLVFSFFSFLFWGFRIDSRVPVPVPIPKLS